MYPLTRKYISMGMHGGKIKIVITFTNHRINIQHNAYPCVYIHGRALDTSIHLTEYNSSVFC